MRVTSSSPGNTPTKKPKKLHCPTCQAVIEWRSDNPNRPFCSERCKNQDFIAWANEDRQIPGDSTESDIFSEDIGGE